LQNNTQHAYTQDNLNEATISSDNFKYISQSDQLSLSKNQNNQKFQTLLENSSGWIDEVGGCSPTIHQNKYQNGGLWYMINIPCSMSITTVPWTTGGKEEVELYWGASGVVPTTTMVLWGDLVYWGGASSCL